ncbi:MAG: hypothetical protein CME19_24520 [Gemmatimonadetes bacterium]|nr:hypothetical protein [Gemmatimonadota bacterium]
MRPACVALCLFLLSPAGLEAHIDHGTGGERILMGEAPDAPDRVASDDQFLPVSRPPYLRMDQPIDLTGNLTVSA